MVFLFKYDGSEERHSELVNMITRISQNHFGEKTKLDSLSESKNGHFLAPGFEFFSHWEPDKVKVEIANDLLFEDMEKAKEGLYRDFRAEGTCCIWDWYSNLQENLSFVPEVEVR